MRRLMVAVLALVVMACGSGTEDPSGETATETHPASAGEVRGADEIKEVLPAMRATFGAEGPMRYVLQSNEICPTCDVVQRESAVIDGVAFPLNRDTRAITMDDAYEALARTLDHEQYDDHVARFDPATGALAHWSARFSPVGGTPDTTGDDHQLVAFDGAVLPADMSECDVDGWHLAGASGFTLRLPPSLTDRAIEGVDSEVAEWSDGELVVTWDYGWYSEPRFGNADERTFVEHQDLVGLHVDGGQRLVVFVPQVVEEGGEWNALLLEIAHSTDDADLARCIAHSIEWT